MSVSSETYKVIYTGDGSTIEFPFTFKVFEEADLKVTKYTIADGSTETLTLDSDYSITLTDDGDSGGTVEMIAPVVNDAVVAPSSDYKIIIQRNLSYLQETDYVENNPFLADTIETDLDRLTMLILQLKEQMDRAVVQDESASMQIVFPESYDWTTDYPATASFGEEGNKPANPEAGAVYIATDVDKYFLCHTDNTWTEYLPSIDEDDMSTDTDEKVPTQQSVKKYVDDNIKSELPSTRMDDWSSTDLVNYLKNIH